MKCEFELIFQLKLPALIFNVSSRLEEVLKKKTKSVRCIHIMLTD